ncbi:MAG: L-histidine N(alpha)-methyltransferase [Sinimarinibacterium sp.]|jgi:dimethylhistidine N-methyltransferase
MRRTYNNATALRVDAGSDFLNDVLAGLRRAPKAIPPKYFYDAAGSALFDRICELPEYYPTRTERAILERGAAEMAQALGPRVLLVEPGAGSGLKTRLLLGALSEPAAYVPVDISGEHLLASADALRTAFPDIDIRPVEADFTRGYALPRPSIPPLRRAVFFPGSTLGNFEPDAARRLLGEFRLLAGRDGRLLLGIDLQKAPDVLEPAYDDAAGVTAQFNLNLLVRINRELGGNFDLDAFAHHAFYNRERTRIEMHLRSRRDQVVRVAGDTFRFRRGETLHTENSYKYTVDSIVQIARAAGWRARRHWSDERSWFALCLFAAA